MAGSSFLQQTRTPMSWAEYLAVETTRTDYVDGVAVMTPASVQHVRVVRRLLLLLDAVAPSGCEVLPELGWNHAPESVRQPDLTVVRTSDLVDADMLRRPPVLVVEVLSPSTSWVDRGRKRRDFAAAGLTDYWLVDPSRRRVELLSVREGSLEVVRVLEAPGRVAVDVPFPVELDLDALFAR